MSDAVNSPAHYVMPDGSEVIDITRWLTSNAGQAVGYLVRSSRTDKVYKGNRGEDLRKAAFLIEDEIRRIDLYETPRNDFRAEDATYETER